jgi:hypothetical protein
MAEKRKIEEVMASPVVRPNDSPAVVAVLADFHDKWNEAKWTQVFSTLSDKEGEEMRAHFKKKKLGQSSFELVKRLPAYRELAEMEIRFGEVLRHAKSRMEEELYDHFSTGNRFRPEAVIELLDKCKPPPAAAFVIPPSVFGSPFGASPFGPQIPFGGAAASSGHVAMPIGAVPLPCSGSPFGSSWGPRPPSGSASSGDGYAIATPPSGSPFGGGLADPSIDLAEVCALELAMASAVVEEDDDEDL